MQRKKIIVAVTASIAAYKSAFLVRLLVKKGVDVQVIMTRNASKLITPLTLATLSKKPVLIDFIKDKTGVWHNHVELGVWADAIVVAPASANTIAKCAHGICDNLLMAVYFSAKCPVFFAPAMDLDMYKHPITQQNLQKLQSYGNHVIPAEYGELASGLIGEGRMAEPEHIVTFLEEFFHKNTVFSGKKVMITAGATREAIDPVRFISNHSTGKMGVAIAECFRQWGAEVHLIAAHLSVTAPAGVHLYKVVSAQDMFEVAKKLAPAMDICVFSAAVADYRPKEVSEQKIKKNHDTLTIELVKNVDIAYTLGKNKLPNQFFVGFALETHNEIENALQKLHRKNFDLIVLNSLNDTGAGFAHDTNKITILQANGSQVHFPLKTKKEVAEDIVRFVAKSLKLID